MVLKIWECNRRIHVVLKNGIGGSVTIFVKYGVNGGIDAWRELCADYIPMAQTKQDIILSDILELKPVKIP